MSNILRTPLPVQGQRFSKPINLNSSRKLYRKIGSVKFLILLQPDTVTYVYEKVIAPIVAERLTRLRTVNEIFALEICENTSTINNFPDAASLVDIMDLREDCWFVPDHCKILATDVLAGISALHEIGLQRNAFYVADVLLVWQKNTFYFQIAGIENCTCFDTHEPAGHAELESFMELLCYVDERLEKSNDRWISGLKDRLRKHHVLDSTALKQAKIYFDLKILSNSRKELEIYIQAVRVLGTTVGGVWNPNSRMQ